MTRAAFGWHVGTWPDEEFPIPPRDQFGWWQNMRLAGDAEPADPNLLTNGSFETDLAPWTGGSSSTVTRVDDRAHDGVWSARVEVHATGGPRGLLNRSTERAPVVAGRTYTSTAWFDCAQVRNVHIGFIPRNATANVLGDWWGPWVEGVVGEWQQIACTLTMPENATSTGLSVRAQTSAPGELFWIDNVRVVEETGGDGNGGIVPPPEITP